MTTAETIRTADLQEATTDSHGSCFLPEIIQIARQMTCFIGYVIYSWVLLDAAQDFRSRASLEVRRSLGAYS